MSAGKDSADINKDEMIMSSQSMVAEAPMDENHRPAAWVGTWAVLVETLRGIAHAKSAGMETLTSRSVQQLRDLGLEPHQIPQNHRQTTLAMMIGA